MKNIFSKFSHRVIPAVFITLLAVVSIPAQGTGFVYQGRLTNSNLSVNAPYDFQFSLFDALSGGTQVGATNAQTSIPVSNGSFAVTLDFGAGAFPGANRWLEISARPAGNGAFTLLTPRLPITPTPYAIKSLTATAADGLSASCNGCISGRQISDLPTGNGNYIQNTTAQQTANFNISGNGLIGGSLGIGTTNPLSRLHVADSTANFKFYTLPKTTVTSLENTAPNSLVALNLQNNSRAWQLRVDGSDASKFRIFDATAIADRLIIDPVGNVGIGTTNPLTKLDISGSDSLFNGVALRLFNANAGNTNQWVFGTGGAYVAKDAFSIGDSSAIRMSILSNGNVGIGTTDPLRKLHMIDSTSNLLFGSEDGSAVMRLLNAAPNSITALILGNKTREWHLRVDGVGAADGKYSIYDNTANAYRLTVDGSGNVGIGTINPTTKLDISGSDSLFNGVALSLFNANAGNTNRWVLGTGGNTVAKDAFSIGDINGYKMTILSNGNVSVGTTTPLDKLHVSGDIRVGVNSLGCIKRSDGSPIAGTCSSDLRFKQQITPFSNLLDKVARLQPVHFYWRAEEFPTRHFGTEQSFGLIAQDVEAVLPELVATDEEGYRAVNYSKLPLLTLQAVKELKGEQDSLKAQNLVLQEQNAVLQARLDKLEQMMRQLLEAAEKPSPKQP